MFVCKFEDFYAFNPTKKAKRACVSSDCLSVSLICRNARPELLDRQIKMPKCVACKICPVQKSLLQNFQNTCLR